MAASPRFKVHDAHGTYQAACKEIEAAAVLVGFYGSGAFVKEGSVKVWIEGADADGCAGDSYDRVGTVAFRRLADRRRELRAADGAES